jgi:hypothetical protein
LRFDRLDERTHVRGAPIGLQFLRLTKRHDCIGDLSNPVCGRGVAPKGQCVAGTLSASLLRKRDEIGVSTLIKKRLSSRGKTTMIGQQRVHAARPFELPPYTEGCPDDKEADEHCKQPLDLHQLAEHFTIHCVSGLRGLTRPS